MNEYNFKQFVLAIKDAGFISKKLITSDITLDFAYTLYLRLLKDSSIDKTKVKNYVQCWYVMSTLTGRYISSPESAMDLDLRRIKEKGFLPWLEEVEKTSLNSAKRENTISVISNQKKQSKKILLITVFHLI